MLARTVFFMAVTPRFYPLERASYARRPFCRVKHTAPAKQLDTSSTEADTKRTFSTSGPGPQNIAAFFAAYPAFDYDPKADAMQECQRLFRYLGVEKLSKANPLRGDHQEVRRRGDVRGRLKVELRSAIAGQFGQSAFDLKDWQHLCRDLVIPTPNTVKECQKVVSLTHVNLKDFDEALKKGEAVTKYDTEVELSEYTKSTKKYYPSKCLKAGNIRRALLRQILNPRPEWKVREDAESAYNKTP